MPLREQWLRVRVRRTRRGEGSARRRNRGAAATPARAGQETEKPQFEGRGGYQPMMW